MEVVGAAVGISDVALRASSKLWTLFAAWKDAPADLHRLREELSRTHRFLGETQEGIEALYSVQRGFQRMTESHASTSELELLVNDSMVILERIDQFIDSLVKPSAMTGLPDIGKRRKMVWMASTKKVAKWRSELRTITSDVCRLLIVQNM